MLLAVPMFPGKRDVHRRAQLITSRKMVTRLTRT
jgi:hypothetical protein